MFEILKKLTGAGKPPSAAELRTARDDIDEAALRRAVEAAEVSRCDALLTGDDEAIEKAEQEVAAARRNLDRARAAAEVLGERIALAEQAEAGAALDAERAAVEAEARATADAIRKAWPSLQLKMVALLDRLDAAEQAVSEVNRKLHAAGRGEEVVQSVEWRARPRPRFQHEAVMSITSNVMLPDIPEWGVSGYGEAISRASAFWSSPPIGSGVPEKDRPGALVFASPSATSFGN